MVNRKINIAILFFAAIITLFVINSCSTKKNTWTRRAFHNVTCHYNIYWNGMQSLEEGKILLSDKVIDDYNSILNVYNYGTKQDATTLNPKMDRAIKKASIGIQRHSMQFGGEEKVKWVKDSYLMMGMAHFYKQDYTSARRVFDYVSKEYESTPISYQAILWLARTYIQTERYEKAEAALNLLQSKLKEEDFPRSVEKEIPIVYAEFYIAQKKYYAAYPYLERGLELSSDYAVVTRVNFIMGQINQLDNDFDNASSYFAKVVKRNPPYKMAFEAQMNIAQCYDDGYGNSNHINKVLLKMLNESKNKEYRDQIYYALSQVALADDKDTLVIHYLKKSVSSSVSDDTQKATSSLELADIYFDNTNYINAQAYYDTASMSLPKDYPNYNSIINKASILSNMVTQIQIITLQDSLQTLAEMDTMQLYAVIDNMIAEYAEEKEKKEEARENGGTQFVDMTRNKPDQALGGGAWYFYNPATISRGRGEFKKIWGDRKLEDMWRLTDKRMMMQAYEEDLTDEEAITQKDSLITLVTDPADREFYLQNIPRTDEQITISDSLIVEAYNTLSYLYLEELQDTTLALNSYVKFQQHYPDNKYKLESWYALYKIYGANNNISDASTYRDLIVNNYPESNYAKVIIDPDYFLKLSQQNNELSKLYSKTYKSFNREQYFRVINYSDQAVELYPKDTALVPKFLYLRAVSLGAVNVVDSLYASLINIIKKYPSNSITPLAQSIVQTLQVEYGIGVPQDTTGGANSKIEKSIYTFKAEDMHLALIIVKSPDINISAFKVRISDFDKKYFRLKRLRVKSLMLDDQQTIITIGNFDSKDEVGNYLLALENDEYVISGLKSNDFTVFSISSSNYPLFYRDKNVETYKTFFNKYYKRK